MKTYSLFQAPLLAFYSRSFYQDVARNRKGTAFGYLLLLLTFLWIPVMTTLHGHITAAMTTYAPPVVNQIPRITIMNGEVSVDVPTPYSIIEPARGTELLLIDTTGKTTSLDRTQAAALLTRDKLMIRQQRKQEVRIYDLSEVHDVTIDRDDAARVAEWVRKWTAAVAYPFALLGSFVYRMLQALLYGLIGMMIAGALKVTLDYAALIRLSVMAVTPVLILKTLRTVLGVEVPYGLLLGFVIAMGYLVYGIKASAGAQPAPNR